MTSGLSEPRRRPVEMSGHRKLVGEEGGGGSGAAALSPLGGTRGRLGATIHYGFWIDHQRLFPPPPADIDGGSRFAVILRIHLLRRQVRGPGGRRGAEAEGR